MIHAPQNEPFWDGEKWVVPNTNTEKTKEQAWQAAWQKLQGIKQEARKHLVTSNLPGFMIPGAMPRWPRMSSMNPQFQSGRDMRQSETPNIRHVPPPPPTQEFRKEGLYNIGIYCGRHCFVYIRTPE